MSVRIAKSASWIIGLAVLAVIGMAWAGHAETANPAEKARLKALDSGVKVIDVSKYPEDMKATYPMFVKKCAKCHSIARPINTTFVLPDQWERYIKRMLYKPDSKLNDEDAKKIFHLLAYDSSVRKADSLRVHLAQLDPDKRTAALARLKEINPAFKYEGK
jgi:hypothetical protein